MKLTLWHVQSGRTLRVRSRQQRPYVSESSCTHAAICPIQEHGIIVVGPVYRRKKQLYMNRWGASWETKKEMCKWETGETKEDMGRQGKKWTQTWKKQGGPRKTSCTTFYALPGKVVDTSGFPNGLAPRYDWPLLKSMGSASRHSQANEVVFDSFLDASETFHWFIRDPRRLPATLFPPPTRKPPSRGHPRHTHV